MDIAVAWPFAVIGVKKAWRAERLFVHVPHREAVARDAASEAAGRDDVQLQGDHVHVRGAEVRPSPILAVAVALAIRVIVACLSLQPAATPSSTHSGKWSLESGRLMEAL